MTDRELLEAAAKAAGLEGYEYMEFHGGCEMAFDPGGSHSEYWNPLTSDGDALRLAVKLEMCFGIAPHRVALDKISLAIAPGGTEVSIKHNDDPYAATRRAIVRAAAEIGSKT